MKSTTTRTPRSIRMALAASVVAAIALAGCNRTEEGTEVSRSDLPGTPSPIAEGPPQSTAGTSTTTSTGTTTTTPGGMIENNPTSAGIPPTGSVSAAWTAMEQDFAKTAAASGLFELETARLAQQKATDSAVKSYAAMLVDHHSMANDKLQQLAMQGNVALPTQLPSDRKAELDQLTKASGAEFDRQFVRVVGIKAHQDDIALFEKAASSANNPALRTFAQNTLPTLRDLLTSAQKLPGAR